MEAGVAVDGAEDYLVSKVLVALTSRAIERRDPAVRA